MYKHFIQGVDAVDNGVEQWKAKVVLPNKKRRKTDNGAGGVDSWMESMKNENGGGENGGAENAADLIEEEEEDAPQVTLEKIYLEETSLSNRVGALNAAWNEEASANVQDERFEKAS